MRLHSLFIACPTSRILRPCPTFWSALFFPKVEPPQDRYFSKTRPSSRLAVRERRERLSSQGRVRCQSNCAHVGQVQLNLSLSSLPYPQQEEIDSHLRVTSYADLVRIWRTLLQRKGAATETGNYSSIVYCAMNQWAKEQNQRLTLSITTCSTLTCPLSHICLAGHCKRCPLVKTFYSPLTNAKMRTKAAIPL